MVSPVRTNGTRHSDPSRRAEREMSGRHELLSWAQSTTSSSHDFWKVTSPPYDLISTCCLATKSRWLTTCASLLFQADQELESSLLQIPEHLLNLVTNRYVVCEMATPKETINLPSIRKRTQSVNPLADNLKGSLHPSIEVQSARDLIVRHNVKRLSIWFKTWHSWQQRILVCHLMKHCSKQHLEFLATALEPILHLDFSSSLVPHMQSLHLDGVARFQIHRSVLQSTINPSVMEVEDSLAYLDSIPTTLLTNSKESSEVTTQDSRIPPVSARSKRVSLLPALPLTHIHHVTAVTTTFQPPGLKNTVSTCRQHFSSVPNFKLTSDLLKHMKCKDLFKPARQQKSHRRSRSVGNYLAVNIGSRREPAQRSDHFQLAEQFKRQLAIVSDWMGEWDAPQKASLLLEVVKLCDKELLGYLVQCLHQRLQDDVGMESLPSAVLLHIFSYLDPQSLGRCSQVCRRWLQLCSLPELWRAHCSELGEKEGVGDLANAVEATSLASGGGRDGEKVEKEREVVIDWKRAYRDLSRVTARIKTLVVQAAQAATELEEEEMECQRQSSTVLSSAALRASFSLREMIHLVKSRTLGGMASTQEVVRSAPESAAAMRRRMRMERREAALQSREKEESCKHHRRHDRTNSRCTVEEKISSRTTAIIAPDGGGRTRERVPAAVELIEMATDNRPSVPYLPDPDGVQCLILAGCLLSHQTPRPDRIHPIHTLRRLKYDSAVLSMQCDQRKIVSGTADGEIHIHDIRSGRHVHTLLGHKGSVQCLQFDEDNIVSGSWDTTCIVWDAVHFSVVKVLRGHTDCVSCLQLDDQRLVTGSYDKSVRVWSTSSWECAAVIGSAHKGPVTCLKFNKSVLITGSTDRSVKIWSFSQCLCTAILVHGAAVVALQLSALLIVSACRDGAVCLWNLHNPHCPLIQWKTTDGVYFSALSISGSRVFGAGSDSVLYEWDIAAGTCLRSLTGHSRPVTAVWVGEHKLVTASEDFTVCVWYTKTTHPKDEETDELDPAFVEIPVVQVTTH